MDNAAETVPVSSELRIALAESQATAREQMLAAWQLHIDKVREALESGWREQVLQIFQERFTEIETTLEEHVDRELRQRTEAAIASQLRDSRAGMHREVTEQLNQTARRLRNAGSRETWISTLLEAASNYCGRAALFQVNGAQMKFEGGLGIGEDREAEFPAGSAPAFANAIESKDTVVSLATRRELSDAAIDLFGGSEGHKVYLFPMVMRRETVGVLYAEPGDADINVPALELVTALAVQSIAEDETVTVQQPSSGLIRINGVPLPPPEAANTQWSLLPKQEQESHLRAQRFARKQVAQMLLYKVDKVRAGRAGANLYATLKEEIDSGRNAFRQQFMSGSPSMVDYYHVELAGTLARNDNTLLGPDYPGPLP